MPGVRLRCLLVLAALLLHVADAKVEELTPKNFKKTVVDSKDVWMVLFYAPWCGHCKAIFPEVGSRALPLHVSGSRVRACVRARARAGMHALMHACVQWKKMAEAVHPSIKVAQVNADEHKELGGQYGVQGFPTIKVFLADKTKPQDYKVRGCAGARVRRLWHAKHTPAASVYEYAYPHTRRGRAPPLAWRRTPCSCWASRSWASSAAARSPAEAAAASQAEARAAPARS